MELETLLKLNPFIFHRTKIENIQSILNFGLQSQKQLKKCGIIKENFGPEIQKIIGDDAISLWVISDLKRGIGPMTIGNLTEEERREKILDVCISAICENEIGLVLKTNVSYFYDNRLCWDYEAYTKEQIDSKKILAIVSKKELLITTDIPIVLIR